MAFRPYKLVLVCIITLLLTGVLGGCAQRATSDGGDETKKLNVVTSTSLTADLAQQVGGDYVTVTALMGPGVDPHAYVPTAGDMEKLRKADVIVITGFNLEQKMGDVISQLENSGVTVVSLEDGISKEKLIYRDAAHDHAHDSNAASDDSPDHDQYDDSDDHHDEASNGEAADPHVWFDTSIWKDAAGYVGTQFSQVDAGHAQEYQKNVQSYQAELDELSDYLTSRASELAPEQRILITSHQSFSYFGRSYGFETLGLQGINTNTEASTADIDSLSSYIADHKVKAIFVETTTPQRNIEALQAAVRAKGFETQVGGSLYTGSLGEPGSEADTYSGMQRANMDMIVNALK